MNRKAWLLVAITAFAAPSAWPQAAAPSLEQGFSQAVGLVHAQNPLQTRLETLNRGILVHAKYAQFLTYLHDVFRGANHAGIPFQSGMCLRTVRELLTGQSVYVGRFDLLIGDCNSAIKRARAAGLLREGLSQAQIEALARRGPVVALIAGSGFHQHVGIVALNGDAVSFFSNSLGTKKIEPLSHRMGSITGIIVLKPAGSTNDRGLE